MGKIGIVLLKSMAFSTVLFFSLVGIALAAAGGHGEVHNSWLAIDTWKTLNFAILFIALFLLVRKPVANFFASRTKGIEDEIRELEEKKAVAEKQFAEYQTKFKNLEQESRKIVEEYIKQGEEAKARILAEAEEQSAKLEQMAKRSIDQEFKAAKLRLKQEIADKVMIKAEELIKASISPDDQNKLVDEYLKKVVA
jgi:F-type H+-transporting ATPase subunit b